MPSRRRPPIEYEPQFAKGMFRPRDQVEAERAGIETTETLTALPQHETPKPGPRARSVERTVERTIVRHSFDVGHDQLLALAELQAQQFSETGRKPKVGTLVQEALDAYIAQRRKRRTERSNERTNGE